MIKDEPDSWGLYVIYTDSYFGPKYTERTLMMYSAHGWNYPMSNHKFSGNVYGCIGPLPTMILEE